MTPHEQLQIINRYTELKKLGWHIQAAPHQTFDIFYPEEVVDMLNLKVGATIHVTSDKLECAICAAEAANDIYLKMRLQPLVNKIVAKEAVKKVDNTSTPAINGAYDKDIVVNDGMVNLLYNAAIKAAEAYGHRSRQCTQLLAALKDRDKIAYQRCSEDIALHVVGG